MRGGGQGNYYLELACEDYYHEGGEPPGKWYGKGAKHLNLAGEVSKETFRNLLQGFNPTRTKPLVQNAGDKNRQSGWDLTFSAPKTVSVAWSQASEDVRQAIQAAQQEAVQAALQYLEAVAAVTRRGRGGSATEKSSFIAATFEHGTSRALDPQLHTHVLVLNISLRDDGTTGTIRSVDIFLHKMAAGAIYRVELAHQLEQRLGLSAERVKSWFELKGVSSELAEEFSKRRKEVEAFLEEHGLKDAVSAKIAALDTREKKGHVARAALFDTWRQTGEEFFFSEKEVRFLIKGPQKITATKDLAQQITGEALQEILTHQSYFTERELVRRVAEASQGSGLSSAQVLSAAQEEIHSTSILQIGEVHGERVFTTQEIIAQEEDLLSLVERSKSKEAHQVSASRLEKVLSKHSKLSAEQREAVKHITTTPGSIQALTGLAGTGKTVTLAAAREAWERQGFTVIGASLSGKAARGLEDGSGIKSATICKTLLDLDKHFIGIDVRKKRVFRRAPDWNSASKLAVPYFKFRFRKGKISLGSKTILVIDEAGMVGTRQMKDLLERAEAAGSKVVLVGDPKQLQPIDAGAPFRAIAERVGAAKLTEIKRQHEEWARQVVKDFSDGRIRKALSELAARGFVSVSKDQEVAERRLISDWRRVGINHPERNLVLTSTNEAAKRLNQLAQERRLKAGTIKRRNVTVGDVKIHEGDRVLFTENAATLDVFNGTLATVNEVSRDTLRVTLDNGKTSIIPLRYYKDIRLGYAATTHKAQGMTTVNAFILIEPNHLTKELAYVQASRACESTTLYTDETTAGPHLTELSKRMEKSEEKAMAHDILERKPDASEDSHAHQAQAANQQYEQTH